MRTIRRSYFYLVALISSLVLVWGITALLRSTLDSSALDHKATALSMGLAQVLVSLPFFLVHWLVVQKDARRSEEERLSAVRAAFLYLLQLCLLIPVVQNGIAILNRILLAWMHLAPARAIVGGFQTTADNLIAMGVNLLFAAYFAQVLRQEWRVDPDRRESLVRVRRLYRHVWMVYSLALALLGLQRLIVFTLTWEIPLGGSITEQLGNAIALLAAGLPLWVACWRSASAVDHPEQGASALPSLVLFFLTLTGQLVLYVNSGRFLYVLLRVLLGSGGSLAGFLSDAAPCLSMAVPFGTFSWFFFRELFADPDHAAGPVRIPSLRRIHRYAMSAVGLGAAFAGLDGLMAFILNSSLMTAFNHPVWISALSVDLAVLGTGMSVWVTHWRPGDRQAAIPGEAGESHRRSIARRFYLYLAVFASVIGIMLAAGFCIYTVLQNLLAEEGAPGYFRVYHLLHTLFLCVLYLLYHVGRIRRDNLLHRQLVAGRQAGFKVLVVRDARSGALAGLEQVFAQQAPGIRLEILEPGAVLPQVLAETRLVIAEGRVLEKDDRLRAVLRDSQVPVLADPSAESRITWLGRHSQPEELAKSCVQAARSLAEGQPLHISPGISPWLVLGYIFAGLFALQLMLALLSNLLR